MDHTPGPWQMKKNKKMSHTPGPGLILEEFGDSSKQNEVIIMGWDEKAGESFDIAHAIIGEGVDAQANANLIAAAPELLAALNSLIKKISNNYNDYEDASAYRQIEDAIKCGEEAIARAIGEYRDE